MECYENGPEGMPRVKRMSDSTIDWVINSVDADGMLMPGEEAYRKLRNVSHALAEEVLARLPEWPALASQAAPQDKTVQQDRADFECWYLERSKENVIGSHDCARQWSAWLARSSGHYHAPSDWKLSPQPWGIAGPQPAPAVAVDATGTDREFLKFWHADHRPTVKNMHSLSHVVVHYIWSAGRAAQSAQAPAGEPVATLTCKGNGGAYIDVGIAAGAGVSRGNLMHIYSDAATGNLFYRTPMDFAARMERIAAPVANAGQAQDGCGACGDGCKGKECRVKSESPPAQAAQPHDDEAAIRLRAICDRLGIGSDVPQDNATLWGAAFAVLGQVRTAPDRKAAQSAGRLSGELVFDLASKYFLWDTTEGWRKATQGTINMTNLLAFTHATIAVQQQAQADGMALLRKLVTGAVGRATLQKLADGQGTETEDGKAWLAAQAAIAAQKGGA